MEELYTKSTESEVEAAVLASAAKNSVFHELKTVGVAIAVSAGESSSAVLIGESSGH